MAVTTVPGWIGQSAVSETGKNWMTEARVALRLSAAGYLSEMAGRSVEQTVNYSIGTNNAYSNATLINYANGLGNRSITNLIITVTGTIISNTAGAPCLNFSAAPFNEFKSVHLIINSGIRVSGRGGNGASLTMTGGAFKSFIAATAGGVGITNSIGTKLRISNNGIISGGGGGGGGAACVYDESDDGAAGGGGCPLGAAGQRGATNNGGVSGAAGTATGAGAGGKSGNATGGAGGGFGAAGATGVAGSGTRKTSGGAAAGAALNGSAPTWGTLGTIQGSRL